MSRRLKRAQAILRRRLIHRGFSLGIALIAALSAVICAWNVCSRPTRHAVAVRDAMASLEPNTDTRGGIETAIAMIDRNESDHDLVRILALARQAIRVAAEIEGCEPGKRAEQWREHLSEMRSSAVLLEQAAGENARLPMLSAARRLNASCIACHEAFSATARKPAPGVGSLEPQAEIIRQPIFHRSVSWFIFEETPVPAARAFDPQTDSTMEVALLALR
jgi:hypothetical protein